MRNRMMFGKYIDTGSFVHGLDPRAKLTAMFIFMATVFVLQSYIGIGIVLLFSIALMLWTRIPLMTYVRTMRPLIFIMLFIIIFHLLFDASGVQIVRLGAFSFYTGGLSRGLLSAARMGLMVTLTAMLTFTTPPERLTLGIGQMLRPFDRIGLRSQRLTLMLSIALRFIPTVFEEAERIWKAQQSRGLTFGGRPLREQARLLLALLVPITAGSFRRAIDLAEAMEARGYRLEAPRTAYQQLTWQGRDTGFLLLFMLLCAIVVFMRVKGW